MPEKSIPHETLPLQGVPQPEGELHERDLVRVKKGKGRKHGGKIGPIERTDHLSDSVPLYFVKLDAGTFVFLRDEIERVESEVGNG